MFSSTSEYALRAIVFLAEHPDGLIASETIARATKVPPKYLSKILRDLVSARLVESRRGPNGGFRLTRAAPRLSVLEVVNAVDPIHRITVCPLGLAAHKRDLCPLHRKLDEAIRLVERALGSALIQDMIAPAGAAAAPVFPTVGGRPHR